MSEIASCALCPRACHARRGALSGEGFCRMGTQPRVARAALHFWEEPCVSGTRGSGTVFFSGCPLQCVFCQNAPISHGGAGTVVTVEALARAFQRLQAMGAHNVNLVNPTHFAPVILDALRLARLSVPVVWNSSGYELPETLRLTEGLVQVFLPDLKYATERTARLCAAAPDYPRFAPDALLTMRRLTGPAVYDTDGLLTRGTLVRHLVLPGLTNESIRLLTWVRDAMPEGTPVSLMRQYTPMNGVAIAGLDRKLTAREYRRVADALRGMGLLGFLQTAESADEGFVPAFNTPDALRLFAD